MTIIGMILAGDGCVEATVAFDTVEEANEKMNALRDQHFDKSFDSVLIGYVQPYDEIVKEIEEAKAEAAQYEAEANPTGYIVSTRMEES